ncbi:MAG: GntR family transcriptional regulator [Actinomycetes bacterium]
MALDHQAPRSLYRQLADQLRSSIYAGELRPGEQLPSERELTETYGVSRNTVRLALQALVNEGLVSSGRGRGYFIRDTRPLLFVASRHESKSRRRVSARDAWVTDVLEQGRVPTQDIEVSIVHASADITARLELQHGESVAVRRRVRHVDGGPYALNVSYYPLDVVRDSPIVAPDDIEQGANKVLADLGHEQVRYLDQITVRMPTPTETDMLQIGAGTPVAEHVRVGYNADGRPVRVATTVLPGDRHIIQYELTGD